MQRTDTLKLRTQDLGYVKMQTQVSKTKQNSEFLQVEASEANEEQKSEI